MIAMSALVRPVVTEKTMASAGASCFAFRVANDANKIDIKNAVESYYGVKVLAVRTCIVRGKVKRAGRRSGKRGNWKKAYVQLVSGQTINLFED